MSRAPPRARRAIPGLLGDGARAHRIGRNAARRELAEETGLAPERLYNLSRVELFYQHRVDHVALVPVFAGFVHHDAMVRLSPEHDGYEWLSPEAARGRFAWPRERRTVDDLVALLGEGHAGAVDDVLRVC